MGFRPNRGSNKSTDNSENLNENGFSSEDSNDESYFPKRQAVNYDSGESREYRPYRTRENGSFEGRSHRNSSENTRENTRRQNNFQVDRKNSRPPYKENREYGQNYGNRDDREAHYNRDDRDSRYNRDDRDSRYSRDDRDSRYSRDDRGSRYSRDDRSTRNNWENNYRSKPAFRPQRNFKDDLNSGQENKFSHSESDTFERSKPQSQPFERKYNEREKTSYQDNYQQKNTRENDFFSPSSFSNDDNQSQSFERKEKRFRDDRPYRNDRSDRNDRPRARGSRRTESIDNLFDVDRSILRLLSKRAELLQVVKRDKRVAPHLEKQLRSSWEKGVAYVTSDARIARDFFNLLQQIEPIMLVDGKPSYYNLAPQFKPVNINLKAFPSSRQMNILFALAASSGALANFDVQLSSHMMSAIKAFNQLGGQLWWEGNEKVLSRGGEGISRHVDKVIPVGEEALTFYLVLAMALQVPSRLKIVGDGPLRFLDTSSLRAFMPQLNARMITVIPGQEGIPVRMESAGMLPKELTLGKSLPADFILALILISSTQAKEEAQRTFIIEEHKEREAIQKELANIFEYLAIEHTFEFEENNLILSVVAKSLSFETLPPIELDSLFALSLLSIPAFAGGKCELKGLLKESDRHCLDFLKSCGLKVESKKNEENELSIVSEHPEVKLKQPDYSLALSYPIALVFASLAALSGEEVVLPKALDMPFALEKEYESEIVEGFLRQIGLYVDENKVLKRGEVENSPWYLPNEEWGLALALVAFMRPNIRITNPDVVSSVYPFFWRIYNTLPEPKLSLPVEEVHEESSRRRIIAKEDENFDNLEDDFVGEEKANLSEEELEEIKISEEYAIDDTLVDDLKND